MRFFTFLLLLATASCTPNVSNVLGTSYLDSFDYPIPAFSYGSNLIYLKNVSSSEECAKYCMELYDGTVCSSFDYSSTTRICDLGLHHTNNELKLKPSFSYRYYKRIYNSDVSARGKYVCPRIQECDCSEYETSHVNHWVIQGKCLDCVCKELNKDGSRCPKKDVCDCTSEEIMVTKTDLNGCEFCSCEVEELVHNEHNVSYPHIRIPVMRMNCGGSSFLDKRGNLWMRDSSYRDGIVFSIDKNSKTSEEQQLKKARGVTDGSDFSYHIRVDEIGEYDALLEVYCTDVNKTADMWIQFEDNLVYQNITCNATSDIHVNNRMYIDDYVVDIVFSPAMNFTQVNSIQLTYLQPISNLSYTEDLCENVINQCNCTENELYVNKTDINGCNTCDCLPIVWRNLSCPTFPSTTSTSTIYTTSPFPTTTVETTVETTLEDVSVDTSTTTLPHNQTCTSTTCSCATESGIMGLFIALFLLSGILNMILYRNIVKNKNTVRNLRQDNFQGREMQTGYSNPLFTAPQEFD